MAQLNGCTADELRNGMKTYGGVDRRFDFKIKNDKLVFLSDYAHHPKRFTRVQRVFVSFTKIARLQPSSSLTSIPAPVISTRTLPTA